MPRRKLADMNIQQAVRAARRAGYDVAWRYEREAYVDGRGNPLPDPPMIHAYATIKVGAVVVKAEDLHNTFENAAEFQDLNGTRIAKHAAIVTRAQEDKAEAEAERDAVDAAPVRGSG